MPLLLRWYAFVPWALVILVIWRQFGWRRALPIGLGGWMIAFAAEWAATSGPGFPFGVYSYRSAGLTQDWRVLGVPLFDSLSFTWLAFVTFTAAGWLGASGARRLVVAALAMVAIDVVVDPVALRGARWWLGSIYSYPAHTGIWYGVSWPNYLGWLVVGLTLQLWLGFWLGGQRQGSRSELVVAALLLVGVLTQSAVLALVLGIAPSALLALLLLVGLGLVAQGAHWPRRPAGRPLVLVACALGSEAQAVCRALGPGWLARPDGGHMRWRRPGRPSIEVWATGLGLAAAAAAARVAPGGTAILVAGVGGACSGDWRVGSVGIGSSVLRSDGGWLELDQSPLNLLVSAEVGGTARFASRGSATDSPADRAALAERGVDIVEMETAAWLAAPSQPPAGRLAALRAVSDTPTAPLGPAANLVPPGSIGPSPVRVARLIVAHPGSLARLLQVGRNQRVALSALGRAVALAAPILERVATSPADLTPGGLQDGQAATPSS